MNRKAKRNKFRNETAKLNIEIKTLKYEKNNYIDKWCIANAEKAQLQLKLDKSEKDVKKYQECYYIDTVYGYVPKCDKCDENRKIHFKSPSGRDCEEECPVCGKYWCKYVIKPIPSIRLRFDNDPGIKCEVIYTYHNEWGDSTNYTNKNIYNGTIDDFNIKTYNRYHTMFSSKELAEQVCDKLNKDAGVPDNLEIKE